MKEIANRCYKCESQSTILDGKVWTCWQHIEACDCTKSHSLTNDWEYGGTYPAIPITIEAMEFQLTADDVEERDLSL